MTVWGMTGIISLGSSSHQRASAGRLVINNPKLQWDDLGHSLAYLAVLARQTWGWHNLGIISLGGYAGTSLVVRKVSYLFPLSHLSLDCLRSYSRSRVSSVCRFAFLLSRICWLDTPFRHWPLFYFSLFFLALLLLRVGFHGSVAVEM